MSIFSQLTHWLEALAHTMPLEVFVALGAFLEEVIAPIPAPSLLTLAGSLALAQGKPTMAILWLGLLGAVGKALGGWVLYWLGHVAEEVVVKKWGKFFGISQKHIEGFSNRFQKNHKDIFVLTAIRALPVIPSAPVSIACGVIKLDIKVYLLSTFLGNIPRNLFFIYLGYGGLHAFRDFRHNLYDFHFWIEISIFIGVIAVAAFLYWKTQKAKKNQTK